MAATNSRHELSYRPNRNLLSSQYLQILFFNNTNL